MRQDKPIGWWLKEVDRLLEDSFARLLADEGLERRYWQLLGSAGSTKALAPFGDADALEPVVDDLVGRGWLRRDGDAVVLTDDGAAARARIGAAVAGLRRRATASVSAEEYALVVDVLRRMAADLADAPAPA